MPINDIIINKEINVDITVHNIKCNFNGFTKYKIYKLQLDCICPD